MLNPGQTIKLGEPLYIEKSQILGNIESDKSKFEYKISVLYDVQITLSGKDTRITDYNLYIGLLASKDVSNLNNVFYNEYIIPKQKNLRESVSIFKYIGLITRNVKFRNNILISPAYKLYSDNNFGKFYLIDYTKESEWKFSKVIYDAVKYNYIFLEKE